MNETHHICTSHVVHAEPSQQELGQQELRQAVGTDTFRALAGQAVPHQPAEQGRIDDSERTQEVRLQVTGTVSE